MRKLGWVLCMTVMASVVYAEGLPPLVGGGGKSLRDLSGSPTLVTLVLNLRDAQVPNCRIKEVTPVTLVVMQGGSNDPVPYQLSTIKEVRVQDTKVETKEFAIDESRTLTIEEQKMVEAALQRTKEIYEMANAEQGHKMHAAMLLTVSGRRDTQDYLRQLASSNDLRTALEAQIYLYLVGDTEHAAKLVEQGLLSGNLPIRGQAAKLAGLVKDQDTVPDLLKMVDDRNEEICCPAAQALARLKNREAIPAMVRLLTENDERKGKAAIFALTRLGGPDIIQRLKDRLDTTKGEMRYRFMVVLYKLGDPLGKTLLLREAMEIQGEVHTQAALLLAENNVWDGKQYLINKLKQKFNENEKNLTFRARAAGVLLQSNDPNAMTVFQELLGAESANARKIVCMLIAELGKPRLLNIMQANTLNPKLDVALEACTAAVAISHKEFRERLIESRQ